MVQKNYIITFELITKKFQLNFNINDDIFVYEKIYEFRKSKY